MQFAYDWGPKLTFWEKIQNLLDLPFAVRRIRWLKQHGTELAPDWLTLLLSRCARFGWKWPR